MEHPDRLTDHAGRRIDFGRTAADYDRHRPGFPPSLFDRLLACGWIAADLDALDLGTGTGALALELAARGLRVTGLDPSAEMLGVARRRASDRGLDIGWVAGTAEATGLDAAVFDLATAGQCWWWLDAPRALAEAARVLRPGGRVLIANFSYLPLPHPDSVAGRTEALILAHNPGWTKAGETAVYAVQVRDLEHAGLRDVESFSYVEPVAFSHAGWRGRIRACNGVGASLSPEQVGAFDDDLAALLAREFAGELTVPHRVFVATGRVATR